VLGKPPGGVSLEVALSQTNLTGNGWTSDTFYPLDSDDPISPYTQRRNFYPSVLGQNGVQAQELVLTLRRINTTETATATFTPVNTPNNNPQAVSIGSSSGGNSPAWAQNLPVAYVYDINTHGFSLLVSPGSLTLQVAISQSNSTGNGWLSGSFYPLTTDDPISPYTHRRNFYPATLGQDGVLPSVASVVILNTATNETATVSFTPEQTPNNVPRTLTLGDGSGGGTIPPGDLPPYAQNLNPAYTYNDQSHAFTVYATPGGNEVQVAVSQAGASGDGWQSDTYLPLVAQSTGQYTHKRDFDPTTSGSDGIVMDADVNVLFRQVDGPAGISPVETGNFRIIPRPTPGGFGPLRPYNPTPTPNPTGRPPYPPVSSFVTANVNNNYSSPGIGYISESTNKAMLDIEFYREDNDLLEGTFRLRNKVELEATAGNVVRYHIDERTWIELANKNMPTNLRFPLGVPLLIAVWRYIFPAPEKEWRNNITSQHGEQRIVVY